MKLAVTGKGGVGKTTVCALLANALREAGRNVIAIDVDPDANLLAAMGHPDPDSIPPLVELKKLIEERTGAKPGSQGAFFKLNPRVDDLPERYAVDVDGIKVLVAGSVKRGGTGCYCPENSLVRALVTEMLLDPDMDLVLDMEAGVEHLGRGTARAVDRLLIVVDPGRRAVETAQRVRGLCADIGIEHIRVVGNRIRSAEDEPFLKEALPDLQFAGFVPYDEAIAHAERDGRPVTGAADAVTDVVRNIVSSFNE